jgi:FdhE protein
MKTSQWDERVQRAAGLAQRFGYAAEILGFYGAVLELQRKIYNEVSREQIAPATDASAFRTQLEAEMDRALRHLPELLSIAAQKGTDQLTADARLVREASPEQLRESLRTFPAGGEGGHAFFAGALLQPVAEWLAQSASRSAATSSSICTICGARPQAAVLRPEGDGGKRFLLCSLCLTEWEFRRVLCPVCGEENHQKLPRYSADDYDWVRVEACDTCHFYLKSIDLTIDGHAVPLVDEVATVPLDLWATEHGYKKTAANLMGF